MDRTLHDDTISAIATPIGEGGIGIVKLSGPDAFTIARRLFRPHHSASPLTSHRLYHGWIVDPASQEMVDEVLLSCMAGPHTYTREDVVEINCHSGYLILNRILELVLQSGARLAAPGEFTRRAFLSGRIDLSQAEAVIDIIHSRSEQSLLLASRNLRGDLRAALGSWRDRLLQLQAEIEAFIDFSDDLDLDESDSASMRHVLDRELISPLRRMLAAYESGRILREGLTLVLVGKPNVGKSSLLNVLLGKDRAIVTPVPGTTRDIIEDSFLLAGVLVRVLDTAGIRLQPDLIESIGIERTLSSAAEADVVLWLIDRSRPLTDEDDRVFEAVSARSYVALLNKCDLPAAVSVAQVQERYNPAAPIVELSVFDPARVEALRNYLSEAFLRRPLEANRSALIPNLRHKICLEQAVAALERAGELLAAGGYGELVSLELHAARKHADSVLGLEADADLLDSIFAKFCIGK